MNDLHSVKRGQQQITLLAHHRLPPSVYWLLGRNSITATWVDARLSMPPHTANHMKLWRESSWRLQTTTLQSQISKSRPSVITAKGSNNHSLAKSRRVGHIGGSPPTQLNKSGEVPKALRPRGVIVVVRMGLLGRVHSTHICMCLKERAT